MTEGSFGNRLSKYLDMVEGEAARLLAEESSPFYQAMKRQREAEKAAQSFAAMIAQRLREDHCWLYTIIERARAYPAQCQEIVDGR